MPLISIAAWKEYTLAFSVVDDDSWVRRVRPRVDIGVYYYMETIVSSVGPGDRASAKRELLRSVT